MWRKKLKNSIACVCTEWDLRMGRALEGREPQACLGLGFFFLPNKKLKYFRGNGLCFNKPSFTVCYEANFHSEDFRPW